MTEPKNSKQTLIDLMKIHYGFSSFRRGQEEAIDAVLAGQPTVVIMPTGGGKSLCYQLPALVLSGITIVISPLIALMKDQVDQLNKIGIAATFINSSLTDKDAAARLEQIKNGLYKLVYIAPERFYNRSFTDSLQNIKIDLFAVDEAHCISQWGHDFRPSYAKLRAAIDLLGRPSVIALTATATPEVRADIIKQLDLNNPRLIITGFSRPNLQFGVIAATDSQKPQIILNAINSLDDPTGIVYTGTRAKTEQILQLLIDNGIDAVGYHAGLDGAAREQVQNDFMSGRTPIIVATNAFGMGVDKKNIHFVIHDQMPGTIESYYQEAGRAGRDGLLSLCLILYHPRDRYLREFFIKGDNPDPAMILEVYDILKNMPVNEVGSLLITYADIKANLSDEVPEMAIGTALKVLEAAGYVRRSRERLGNAWLRLLSSSQNALAGLSPKAKSQKHLLTLLLDNYREPLTKGWEISLEDLSSLLNTKKASLQRLVKKLTDDGILDYRPPFKGTEIFLLQRTEKENVNIDFQALNKKMRAAYAKLDKVEDYIYHQDCRQSFILDYFGDNNYQSCGHCDLCLNGRGLNKKTNSLQPPIRQRRQNIVAETSLSDIKVAAPFVTKLTQLQTFELWNQGLNPADIATQRNLSSNTVIEHLCYLLEKKMPIDIDRIVSRKTQQQIIKVIEKLGDTKLKPLKDELGDEIGYDEIKLVIAHHKTHKL